VGSEIQGNWFCGGVFYMCANELHIAVALIRGKCDLEQPHLDRARKTVWTGLFGDKR